MQSVDREARLSAVREHLCALEGLCGEIERGLMARQWDRVQIAVADSRRLTHALQNALEDSKDERDQAFDEETFRRLRYVFAIRENQMARLKQYHNSVAERLESLGRWKQILRSLANRSTPRASSLDRVS